MFPSRLVRSMNSSQSNAARYVKFPGHGLGYGGEWRSVCLCAELLLFASWVDWAFVVIWFIHLPWSVSLSLPF